MGMNRTAVFLDAGHIEKVLGREFPDTRIDFGAFVREISRGQDLLRAYYYNCPPHLDSPPTPEQVRRQSNADRFYEALRQIPRFEVRLGRLEKRECPQCGRSDFRQKGADLLLAVDLVALSAKVQIGRAILVAGDSGLLPAVRVAKDCGVLVHLFHGGKAHAPHQDLYDACDERTLIDRGLIDRSRRANR